MTEERKHKLVAGHSRVILTKMATEQINDPVRNLAGIKMLAVYGLRFIQIVYDEDREPSSEELLAYVQTCFKTVANFVGLKLGDLPKV